MTKTKPPKTERYPQSACCEQLLRRRRAGQECAGSTNGIPYAPRAARNACGITWWEPRAFRRPRAFDNRQGLWIQPAAAGHTRPSDKCGYAVPPDRAVVPDSGDRASDPAGVPDCAGWSMPGGLGSRDPATGITAQTIRNYRQGAARLSRFGCTGDVDRATDDATEATLPRLDPPTPVKPLEPWAGVSAGYRATAFGYAERSHTGTDITILYHTTSQRRIVRISG